MKRQRGIWGYGVANLRYVVSAHDRALPDRRRHCSLYAVPMMNLPNSDDRRHLQHAAAEIYGMTTNVTTPVLYALGTVTTVFSFIVIAAALGSFSSLNRSRSRG